MQVTFWGAAQTVTGSMHQVMAGSGRYLLDCGLFQGRRSEARMRNLHFPFQPQDISAVILSHAHIDHIGNLPNLVRSGFRGPIFCSPATADLAEPMLLDSAHLQEKDAEYLNKRVWRRRLLLPDHPDGLVEPLYTTQVAEQVFPLLQPRSLHIRSELEPGVSYQAWDAGHMLGSTFLCLTDATGKTPVRLLFSGDLGRRNLPIIPDPEPAPPADYLILESTYGDRLHKDLEQTRSRLATIVRQTAERGGKLIIPAFAVGRTQQLLLLLHQLLRDRLIPQIPVFVDSPLASRITQVFARNAASFDAETRAFADLVTTPFGFPGLRFTQSVEESKAINDLRVPCIIISASGMCESGRILHHLRHNLPDARNTILFAGFQAQHTLGRKILDGEQEVPVLGDRVPVRAHVEEISELSGHADQSELLAWVEPIARDLRAVFLVHGERQAMEALSKVLQQRFSIPVVIPAPGQNVQLE